MAEALVPGTERCLVRQTKRRSHVIKFLATQCEQSQATGQVTISSSESGASDCPEYVML